MLALKDLDVLGLFVAPAFPCLVAALLICAPLRWLSDRLSLGRFVWNRALFDLCVLVCVTDLLEGVMNLRQAEPRFST